MGIGLTGDGESNCCQPFAAKSSGSTRVLLCAIARSRLLHVDWEQLGFKMLLIVAGTTSLVLPVVDVEARRILLPSGLVITLVVAGLQFNCVLGE